MKFVVQDSCSDTHAVCKCLKKHFYRPLPKICLVDVSCHHVHLCVTQPPAPPYKYIWALAQPCTCAHKHGNTHECTHIPTHADTRVHTPCSKIIALIYMHTHQHSHAQSGGGLEINMPYTFKLILHLASNLCFLELDLTLTASCLNQKITIT